MAGTVGGYLFGYFNGRAERTHGERLARAARLHEQRVDLYAEVAALLQRDKDFLYTTEAMATLFPRPEPPQYQPQRAKDVWRAVDGRVRVVGSEPVSNAVSRAQIAVRKFELSVQDYRDMLASQADDLIAATSDEERERIRTTRPAGFGTAAERVNQTRNDASALIDKAHSVMREELAGL